MAVRPIHRAVSPLHLSVCTVLLLVSAATAANPPGRPIQFGATEATSTNLNRLPAREDSLNPYSQAPETTPKFGNRPSSMDGVIVPLRQQQARPNARSQRAKDFLELRRNWAVMNNEGNVMDIEEEQTIEKLRGSKDKEEEDKLNLTPEERFLLGLYDKKKSDDKNNPTGRKSSDESDPATEDYSLPSALKERDENLRLFLESDADQRGKDAKSSSPFDLEIPRNGLKLPGNNLFGMGQVSAPEQSPAQKARMDEFRQILGLPAVSDPMKDLLKPRSAPTFNSLRQDYSTPSGLNSASTPAPIPEGRFGMVPALPGPTVESKLPVSVPSLTPPPAPVDNSRATTPAAPTFLAPKRFF